MIPISSFVKIEKVVEANFEGITVCLLLFSFAERV